MVQIQMQKSGFEEKRGSRLKENLVRLRRQRTNGQYTVTIPQGVAKSLRLEGGEILQVFIDKGDIVLRIIE